MPVRANMLNGHAICHGGFIFAPVDTAFACACNSDDHVTVAAGAHIDFLASARENDQLTATAKQVSRRGKTGVFDISVTNQTGGTLALFRGNSHRIGGRVLNDE